MIPNSQAPKRKALRYKSLWQFFGVPISQAPRRNCMVGKEIWPKRTFSARGRSRASCRRASVADFPIHRSVLRTHRPGNRRRE